MGILLQIVKIFQVLDSGLISRKNLHGVSPVTGNLLLTKPTFGNFAAITSNQLNRFHAIFCLPNKDFGNFATTIPIQLNRFHVISCSLSQDIGSTESFSCNFLPIKPRFRRFRRYSSNPTESFSRNFCTMKYE